MLKTLFHQNAELVNNIFSSSVENFGIIVREVFKMPKTKFCMFIFIAIFPIHGCEIVDLDGNCIGKHYL